MTHLEYESYVPLALKTMGQILDEARRLPPPPPLEGGSAQTCCPRPDGQGHGHSRGLESSEPSSPPRIDVSAIRLAHLLGPSPPLTPSIVICVASPHRREAFWLTEWLLERVKERVQVWKREYYAAESGLASETASFVGRDGDGPDGRGGRAPMPPASDVGEGLGAHSSWKENFGPDVLARLENPN